MTAEIKILLERMADSANAAQAHYQVWFTLRAEGKALPEYYDDMNDYRYVDFFRASNSGHYKLVFIELGCLFDLDRRAASVKNLKTKLGKMGRSDLVQKIDAEYKEFEDLIANIRKIRSRLIAHKDIGAVPQDVYSEYSLQPEKIAEIIRRSCSLINSVYLEIFQENRLIACENNRYEKATFGLLKVLRNGRSSK